MYCPKCSQQQVSEFVRFCSRCGFPLHVVSDLLAHNGVLTEPETKSEEVRLTPRQKGVRQGVTLMFVGLVVSFIVAVLSIFVFGKPEVFITIANAIFFLGGMLRILYAYIFEQGAKTKRPNYEPPYLGENANSFALPPPQSVPVTGFRAQRSNTAEMVNPPSVTEHTTKLLDEK